MYWRFETGVRKAFTCLKDRTPVEYESGPVGNGGREGVFLRTRAFNLRLTRDRLFVLAEISAVEEPSLWLFLQDVFRVLGVTPVQPVWGEREDARLRRLAGAVCRRYQLLAHALAPDRATDTISRAQAHMIRSTRLASVGLEWLSAVARNQAASLEIRSTITGSRAMFDRASNYLSIDGPGVQRLVVFQPRRGQAFWHDLQERREGGAPPETEYLAHEERQLIIGVLQTIGSGESPEELLRAWQALAGQVEDGYERTLLEYIDDLAVRDVLERVMVSLAPLAGRGFGGAIREVDARFVAATFNWPRPLVGRVERAAPAWWYFRVPKDPTGELARDLRALNAAGGEGAPILG